MKKAFLISVFILLWAYASKVDMSLFAQTTNKETFQQLYFIKTYDNKYFPCFFLDENKLLNCYYRNFPNYPFDLLDEKTFKAIYGE